jgi:hypothetical protein
MASTFYWIGGSGTWTSTNTANFSFSSGGTSAGVIPGIDDTVNFDTNSGFSTNSSTPSTVTISGTVTVGYITDSSGSGDNNYHTFEGVTGAILNVGGSISLNGRTCKGVGASVPFAINFLGTAAGLVSNRGLLKLENTGTNLYPSVSFNTCPITINVTHSSTTPFYIIGKGSAFTVVSGSVLTCGTFTVAKGYVTYYVETLSCVTFDLKTTPVSITHNFNVGTNQVISVTGASGFINSGTGGLSTLTWNGGTSIINITNPNAAFQPIPNVNSTSSGTKTYPTVNFTSTDAGTRRLTLNSTAVITNLNVYAPSFNGFVTLQCAAQTSPTNTSLPAYNITNLYSTGLTEFKRVFIRTTTMGSKIALTLTTFGSGYHYDFMNVSWVGTLINLGSTTAGNCGGNSNMLLPSTRTLYWCISGVGNRDFYAGWYTNSSGSGTATLPRAQDDCYFWGNTSVGGAIDINMTGPYNIGSLITTPTRAGTTGATSIALNFQTDFNFYRGITFPSTYYNSGSTFTVTNAGAYKINFLLADGADASFNLDSFAVNYFPIPIMVTAYPYAGLSNSAAAYIGGGLTLQNDACIKCNGYINLMSSGTTIDTSGFTGLTGSYAVDGGNVGGGFTLASANYLGSTLAKVTTGKFTVSGTQYVSNLYSDTNDVSITISGATGTLTFYGTNKVNSITGFNGSTRAVILSSSPTDYVETNSLTYTPTLTGTLTITSDSAGVQGTFKVANNVTVTRWNIKDNKIISPTTTVYTYTANSSTDSGNNTGWNFGTTPVVTVGGKFFLVF